MWYNISEGKNISTIILDFWIFLCRCIKDCGNETSHFAIGCHTQYRSDAHFDSLEKAWLRSIDLVLHKHKMLIQWTYLSLLLQILYQSSSWYKLCSSNMIKRNPNIEMNKNLVNCTRNQAAQVVLAREEVWKWTWKGRDSLQ